MFFHKLLSTMWSHYKVYVYRNTQCSKVVYLYSNITKLSIKKMLESNEVKFAIKVRFQIFMVAMHIVSHGPSSPTEIYTCWHKMAHSIVKFSKSTDLILFMKSKLFASLQELCSWHIASHGSFSITSRTKTRVTVNTSPLSTSSVHKQWSIC